jgi:LPXTG-motif cell wall-anchored protein
MKRETNKGLSTLLAGAMMLSVLWGPKTALAAEQITMGTAADFAVLAGQTITNTGATTITGDAGIHPGSAFPGLPDVTLNGAVHLADAVALQAQADLVSAYDQAAGRAEETLIPSELGEKTLKQGVYVSETGAFEINGKLTLDAEGDANAVFIFKTETTLTTFSGSEVELINGAKFCGVYWKVGSSATLGSSSFFAGRILALTSIALGTGANVQGQLLARNGSVTLQGNKINNGPCGTPSIDVEGIKIWEGGPEVRPTISLQLFKNGYKHGVPVELVSGVTSYLWKDMRSTDGYGKAFVYTVEEVTTPAPYDMTKEGLTVTNTWNGGSVEFYKHDEDHKALAGAVFGLYNLEDVGFEAPVAEATSDAAGLVSFGGVRIGTYVIREITAPAGYNRSDTVLEVTLETAGDIVIPEPAMLVNTTIRGSVVVEKVDEDGNPLAGAEFTLYRGGVKVGEARTTAAEGRVTFTGIAYGTYTVKETKAPLGYVRDDTAREVSIVKDGVAEKITVTNNSITGEVTITKTDEATGKALAGAQFTIVNEAGAKVFIGTTPVSGILSVTLPFGKFLVSETAAPKDYVRTTKTYSVDITEDGQTFKIDIENEAVAVAPTPEKPLPGAGETLPETGGIPSGFFYLIGALAIAGGILMMRRKRNA